ncbi:Putative kinesin motor domain, P-loop containing nucleoside triphosphate hydrolase [Septoria linicola]|uniref:Kinesin motor domain, P-loop containing nucleoside triphosphate hydrolase n=1 Tax=Septoria linicola TaxID=215465 RepID=A0A9Q9EMU0_9PEZI|nr:putative kinesin motor domain, P-loop containing nucleoside triphosphate hydrolase [Septoria linicola]USW57121.1 Putative kinesin motor domain, P-loop containing nucleoside triphosphate hydrolase [Septoria linicola]
MEPTSPPPLSPGVHQAQVQRPSTASMRHNHKRTQSRFADHASDDEGPRTSVKVAVRVRPPLRPTDPGFDLIPQRFRESTCEVPTDSNLSVQSPQGKKLFVFDRVFDESTTQEGVWEYMSDSVTSFVKGYNVSILAYGQSGAGKSYTMGTSGPEDQDEAEVKGIVPRAAEALFEKLNGAPVTRPSGLQTPKRYSTQALPNHAMLQKATNGAAKNWELRASYVEIYNEQLRDLLVPESVPQAERAQVAIREDIKGRIMLTGLTQVPVNSAEDMLNALNFGSQIRQTDATAINARSSRSHAVFSLNLIQKKHDPSGQTSKTDTRRSMSIEQLNGGESVVTLDSKLHFVDLAGSERLKNTGATGDRAKEGISINAGLASLGKVISQLSSKGGNGHISYRDSRLTRLLQDSLGGNAITFMVACVTPAVFHLSETLNTVTYAQRARAIQSKPEIQQTHEETDKQAAIDRLRAEVSFLRDQIRHAEHSNGRALDGHDRTDRSRGRENELQSQLMDMQENYNALSQRHAKLIAEISKSRDNENVDTPLLNEAIGENASERIKRSNSFAEAVEQVVLEYEKTIQSLETSLSQTRSSLSSSESTLLEKETRIAYMDTIQKQLQTRIAKYMEREANNDSYTRDLEDKMEGASSEEDRKDTMISELRKEIARVRDSEGNAEEYISTLEERLAEAEQDQEIMQREIDRLEHVVERQRSIGRLDNLLGELDGMREPTTNGRASTHSPEPVPKTNGHAEDYDPFRGPTSTNGDDDFEKIEHESTAIEEHPKRASTAEPERTPAQDDFVAEKLENLTQEFFDLRSEHESVLTDYDNLQQKYRTALETLAKLEYGKEVGAKVQQDDDSSVSSSRNSFLAEAGMKDEDKATEGQLSSSRSSRSELSSQQAQNGGAVDKATRISGSESPAVATASPTTDEHQQVLHEMETLKKLHAEKEVSVAELTKNYMSLAQRHEATLSHVEELKQEVQSSKRSSSPAFPSSPSFGSSPGLPPKGSWRRRSEEILGSNSDRASRSYVSLRTMALNNFEDQADVRHTFEQHLNTVMTELHSRSERVQSLEAEIATLRKDMEQKQTIITGLTRERSSLAAVSASGVDFSVVGQMREQLMESENKIRSLHEQHAAREKQLEEEVAHLKATIAEHQNFAGDSLPTPIDLPGHFPATPGMEITPQMMMPSEQATEGASRSTQHDEVDRLQKEVAAWEVKHREAVDSMTASQNNLMKTISELQSSLNKAEATDRSAPEPGNTITEEVLVEERAKHQAIVDTLNTQVQEHKTIAEERVTRLEELQQQYGDMQKQLEGDGVSRELTQKELAQHKELVSNLESQLQVHKSAITIHQESLESLQASHTKEVEEHNARYTELQQKHEQVTADLEKQAEEAKSEVTGLLRLASSALGYETDRTQLHSHISGLVEEGKELHGRHLKTTNDLKAVQEELQNAVNRSSDLESGLEQLRVVSEERGKKLEEITDKYNKTSALVDQLEEQLNSTYDEHQATNKRLSSMQSETNEARTALEKELEDAKARGVHLEQQLNAFKHLSLTSNASSQWNRDSLSPDAATLALGRQASSSSTQRKSGPAALPTPPPSIPLPPLPGSPISANSQGNTLDRTTSPTPRGQSPLGGSPPASRHTSHEVSPSPAASQLIEDQEARIRTIEKHLFAEKQLTATLEEALVDLETSANRTKSEMENWRKKCQSLEDELVSLRKERSNSRASLQAVEEEREMRMRAEKARTALEQRMQELNANKKKKKSGLNCF